MFSTIASFLDRRPKLAMVIFVTMSVFVLVTGLNLLERSASTYQVTVVYCDTRPPKVIQVKTRTVPSHHMIKTYKLAVPVFMSEINVCDIQDVTLIKE